MLLLTHNVKKIKGAAHKNGEVDGTCKWTLPEGNNCKYIEFKKIGPSGLSCFKDMDICHVISCTSCESKGDFV